jgi:hypothetical protein
MLCLFYTMRKDEARYALNPDILSIIILKKF